MGYRGRVGRIGSEIAELQRKDGRERQKAVQSRSAARQLLEESDGMSKVLRRDREAKAAYLEQRAVRSERRAAAFQKKLAERGSKLGRAMGSARRSGAAFWGDDRRETAEMVYDVCLTFADEQRYYVSPVFEGLKERGYEVFYDEATPTHIWGEHMTERFDGVFRKESRRCVMFISAEYLQKTWTKWERRSALDRAREDDDYLLPARFDDTELPGLPPSVGYVDLRRYSPEQFVALVAARIGPPS